MQRVRMSLPHFRSFGWEPIVLGVDSEFSSRTQDPLLLETIPSDVEIHRVLAFRERWTRKVGIGNIGIRALPYLYRKGLDLIESRGVDLVYFSTTMFAVMPLGRVWKAQTGTPYVLDMQDPWVSDYQPTSGEIDRDLKYWVMHGLHRLMEPWTMRRADGLIAVSEDYITTLRRRYPELADRPAKTIPFAATERDIEVAQQSEVANPIFDPDDGYVHGVYAGRGGHDMVPALRILFGAFHKGLKEELERFRKIRLHFVGTSYASDGRAQKTVEPIAEEFGVSEYVHEKPERIPYFEAQKVLTEGDLLVVPGSDDPQYTASKIYPYILSRRPILAVFHEQSSVVDVINDVNAGAVLPFDGRNDEKYFGPLLEKWCDILQRLPEAPNTNWEAFEKFTDKEMTRRQCKVFDRVVPSG
jgi:hypothetical protein